MLPCPLLIPAPESYPLRLATDFVFLCGASFRLFFLSPLRLRTIDSHHKNRKSLCVRLNFMAIASTILSLRRNQSSSVELLLGALDWERAATQYDHRAARHYAVLQAVDQVLLNVAAHAAAQQILFAGTDFALIPPRRPARRSFPKASPRRRMTRHLNQLTFAAFSN